MVGLFEPLRAAPDDRALAGGLLGAPKRERRADTLLHRAVYGDLRTDDSTWTVCNIGPSGGGPARAALTQRK